MVYKNPMRYIFLAGGMIFVASMIVSIRRRNALLQYLQEAKLNDHTTKTEEEKYIYSM